MAKGGRRRWGALLGMVFGGLLAVTAADMGTAQSVGRLVAEREAAGDFRGADLVLQRALNGAAITAEERREWEFERDRLNRIRRDFRLSRAGLFESLRGQLRDFGEAEFEAWVGEGRFDRRVIDGEEWFFVSSPSNLFFRHPGLETRRIRPRDTRAREGAHWEAARDVREAASRAGTPYVLPKSFRVRMKLTVASGAVPPGQEIRAWLPVPRRFPFQDGFVLRRASPTLAASDDLAPEDSPIRSVHLRQPAPAEGPTVFEVEYEYGTRGVWFDLDPGRSRPFAGGVSEAWRPFLAEGPHVVFTEAMRRLAAEIDGGETNAVRRARMYYEWIAAHVKYSYAPEYSTIRNLAEACRSEGRGDCGQAALLFITLCRQAGIPARWQSGWSLFPGDETIHDWCEIHLEPWGWVPVDPYMGVYAEQYATSLNPSQRRELRDFYFGGLDGWRMAANSDHNRELAPAKRSLRSDPVDFQRGEVEAGGRNVYFDRFDYDLTWEELPAPAGGSTWPAWLDRERVGWLAAQATNGVIAAARLAELCDTFGPRFSGTQPLEEAIDWALARLREDGFENVRGEPVAVPRWVRGRESLEWIEPGRGPATLPMLGLGGSTNTPIEGLTAPVLVVTNFNELEARMNEASDRIVVFNFPFTNYGESVRFRYRGAVEAAKAGAVASLIRSLTPFSLQTPHTGGMGYEDGIRRIPHAAITVEDAERLARWQERGRTPVLRLRMEARDLPDAVSRNVVAEWRGRERPEEIVVVGGHFDSWDVGQGALDDGGGCLAAWEALRLIKARGPRPRRTVRLVLWTNEENGLRGAKAYPEAHRDELARHVVAIESDWGIGPLRGFAFTGSERANAQIREFTPALALLGAAEWKAGAGGSDLGPLLREGVPVMDLWTDRRDYFWFHHTATDTVDKVDRAELNRCVAALALLVYALAEMPEPLAR